MTFEEKIQNYNEAKAERSELTLELRRITGFFNRDSQNRDNARAINAGKVSVKFAGTACMLPIGIFTAELQKRKKEVEDRVARIDQELATFE